MARGPNRTYTTWKYVGQLGPHCKAMLKCYPQTPAQRTKHGSAQRKQIRILIFSCWLPGVSLPSGQRMMGDLKGSLRLPADPVSSICILQAALLRATLACLAGRAALSHLALPGLRFLIPESRTAALPLLPQLHGRVQPGCAHCGSLACEPLDVIPYLFSEGATLSSPAGG